MEGQFRVHLHIAQGTLLALDDHLLHNVACNVQGDIDGCGLFGLQVEGKQGVLTAQGLEMEFDIAV